MCTFWSDSLITPVHNFCSIHLLYHPTLVKVYTAKLKPFPRNSLTSPPIRFYSSMFQYTVLVATYPQPPPVLPQSLTIMAAKAANSCDFHDDLPSHWEQRWRDQTASANSADVRSCWADNCWRSCSHAVLKLLQLNPSSEPQITPWGDTVPWC